MLYTNVAGNPIKLTFYFHTPRTSVSQALTLNGYHVLPKQDLS